MKTAFFSQFKPVFDRFLSNLMPVFTVIFRFLLVPEMMAEDFIKRSWRRYRIEKFAIEIMQAPKVNDMTVEDVVGTAVDFVDAIDERCGFGGE